MKILVTGAAGFIGSHAAERFAELGHDVVGIDCFTDYYSTELKELNAKHIGEKGVKMFRVDLAEDDLTEAVDGVEIVLHLAGQPGISDTTPFEQYVRNNFTAAYRLIEAVKDLPTLKCFINIATSSVYGFHATDDETAPPKPTSYYGVTKLAAEQLVLAYQRDKGLPACSLRLFSVYGPRERPEKLYPRVCKSILDDYSFPLYEGSEKHERSYTYVGDIVDAFVAMLDKYAECDGEIFNIGTDQCITTGEGIKHVENALGEKAKPEAKPKRAGDQLKTHANIDKARRVLGYEPKTSAAEGLAAEARWYKDHIWNKIEIVK